MKAVIFVVLTLLWLGGDEPAPCKQAREIRDRLGENLDGLMFMPDTIPGRRTDSLITIRQWVEILERKCDSLKQTQ